MPDDATVESATDEVTDQQNDRAAETVAEIIQSASTRQQTGATPDDDSDAAEADENEETGEEESGDDKDTTDWQAEAEKWKKLARKHEQRAKTNGTTAQQASDQIAAIAEALGLGKDDKPDPEALQRSLTEKDDLLWELQLERSAEKAARAAGADPELLVPVLFHSGALDDLEPDADDWDDTVAKLAADLVKKNPKLRAAAAARTAVPDLKQGNRGAAAQRSDDPNEWLRTAGRRNRQ